MSWFLGGMAFLLLGYFTYGRLVERIVGPDDRKTPWVIGGSSEYAGGKQGFFYLMSKPAAPSNRSGRPDTADIQHD